MSEEKIPESLSVPSSSGQSTSPGVSKRHGLTRAATGVPGAIQKDDQDFTKRRRSVYGVSLGTVLFSAAINSIPLALCQHRRNLLK